MKSPGSALSFYAVAVIIAVVLGVLLFQCRKDPVLFPKGASPTPTPATNSVAPTPAPVAQVASTPSVAAALATFVTPTPIALQDGKTLDYSSGKAVVKDSAQEKAIIEAAVKEMDAAASGITFGPSAPTPTRP